MSWDVRRAGAGASSRLRLQSRQMQEDTSQGIEIYFAVTVLYFICAFTANRVMAVIEKRTRIPGNIAGQH